jgi:TolB-like protein/Flp pilus assembly protein TadD
VSNAASLITLGVFAAGLRFRALSTAPDLHIKSLAVLPLKSLGRQAEDEYLGMGFAADVITKVSQIRDLTVRPTSAVRKFALLNTSAIDAGRELNVDSVLEGTFQRLGDHVRVNVNLLNVRLGRSVWSDTFDIDSASIFDVQDRLSRSILSQLRVKLSPMEGEQLAKRYTASAEAHKYYLQGDEAFDERSILPNDDASLKYAISLFKRAIEADPNYALARAQLAYCYTWMALFTEPQNAMWIQLARDELSQTIKLDPQLPQAHVVRQEIYWSRYEGFNIGEALRELRSAQQLDPTAGLTQLGVIYDHLGFEGQALRALERGIEIDPTSDTAMDRLVEAYALLGHHNEALAAARRFGQTGQGRIVLVLLWNKDYGEAERFVMKGLTDSPGEPMMLSGRALLLALTGNFEAAYRDLPVAARNAEGSRAFHHTAYNIACVYALARRTGDAVEWLTKTADTGMPNLPLFARDPHLDNIRTQPAFVAFMAELKTRWDRLKHEFE